MLAKFADIWQFMQNQWPSAPTYTEKDYPDLVGRVYIVTGAVGLAVEVTKLLIGRGAKVYIMGRNEQKAQACVDKLRQEFPEAQVDFFTADLGDLSTIGPGVQKFLSQETELHGVIHNAGVMPSNRGARVKSNDLELMVGTNNVGPHLLQKYLDGILFRTAAKQPRGSVRVVWVTSCMHVAANHEGGVNWDDINYDKSPKTSAAVLYGQSKAINIIQSYMWSKKNDAAEAGILSLSVHPGSLDTELTRDSPSILRWIVRRVLLHPAKLGAYSELFALLNPTLTVEKNTGGYIIPWGKIGFARQDVDTGMKGANGERLWSWLDDKVMPFYKSA
ncbi:uncharacterized protein V1510DRAFT_416272 [Dipodascopsis tothii]|uniref:uncharacterized protein n=1 Tax=Dipodascopsis tothii TaxID=44089 RepID=UPI0034CFA577